MKLVFTKEEQKGKKNQTQIVGIQVDSPQNCKIFPIQNPESRTGLCPHVLNIKSERSPPKTWVHTQKTLPHMLQHSFGHGTQ
jgi:hypothetical protein